MPRSTASDDEYEPSPGRGRGAAGDVIQNLPYDESLELSQETEARRSPTASRDVAQGLRGRQRRRFGSPSGGAPSIGTRRARPPTRVEVGVVVRVVRTLDEVGAWTGRVLVVLLLVFVVVITGSGLRHHTHPHAAARSSARAARPRALR